MASRAESAALGLLRKLTDIVYRYPRLFVIPQIILAVICVAYTAARLEFNTSRNDLVGKDKKYHQIYLQYRAEFPQQDDLVVLVESENMEKNRQFVERLGQRLEQETNLFSDVFYKGDLKMLGKKALLFLDTNSLVELDKTLQIYRPFIQNFTGTTNLNSLFRLINRQFRTASREANADNESMIKAMPALQRILTEASASLLRPGNPPSPGLNALFGADKEAEQKMYITFADGRIYLVNAHAVSEDQNFVAVERLRELVKETEAEVSGLNIGVTGEPVLEYDEMAQSKYDTTVATIVSLVLCALIFIYGYQETGRPIKATFCLLIGLCYTVGFTTLTVGHLNILTITFLPMLIGLCIDFGVHLISRYEEELRHGKTARAALEKAMVFTGMGIFTGCFTTAGAFLAMGITNFRGIQEMGFISGSGLLICLVPMMTLLPVLLLRGRQNVIDQKTHEVDRRARVEQIWLQRPVWVVCLTAGLCILALTQFPKVFFDYNLLNMQSEGLPAVLTEKKLIDSATNSVLFGAVVADSLPQAVELEQKLTNLTTVANVQSVSSFLASDEKDSLELISHVKQLVSDIAFQPLDPRPVNLLELDSTLFAFQGYLGNAMIEVAKEGDTNLLHSLTAIHEAVKTFRDRMGRGDPKLVADKLGAFQRALFSDLVASFEALRTQDDSGPLRANDLPPALRNRFIGKHGKYLLQVFPKEDVWQRDKQEAFVKQLQSVDPRATGTPVQLYYYTSLLKSSYEQAAYYSLAAIAILVFIHFRSLACVLLSLLPVGIGTIWMVGIMGWTSTPFNPADIMTLPLVIGIGVTSGIHILNRFAEEQTPNILAKSTGLAVIVSALTTVAGFGSLVLAQHQGIRSLGFVMAVGTTTCMLAAVTFLPAVISLLIRAGWTIKKPSGENAHSTPGWEEPRQKPQSLVAQK